MNRHARRNVVIGGLVAICGTIGLVAGMASAERQPEEMDMMNMDPNAIMEMMAQAAKPGEHHAMLKKMAGDWDLVAKFWMEPGGDPEISKGWTGSKMMLGGRQLVGHVKMDFNFGGQIIPFEGVSMMGYDNLKGEFSAMWTDTMMTGHSTYTGHTKDGTIVLEGVNNTPMGESKMKQVYSFPADDRYTIDFYEPNPMTGEMMRTGVLEYTRAEKADQKDKHGDHDG